MMRLLRFTAAALLAAFAVAACSSDNSTSNSTSNTPASTTTAGGGGQSAGATITIKDFKFGDPITVKPGESVKVTNEDGAAHNAVADDGSFKTEDLENGESGTFTAPSKAGTYKFSCTLHSSMSGIGTLIVQG
jgi:plastocyanin